MLDHQDKYMMKAQVHVSKSSAISDVQPLPRRKHYCQIYQVVMHMLRGRLLASFQDLEHEGGDTRSQGGIKDNDSKIKIQDHWRENDLSNEFPRTRLQVPRKAIDGNDKAIRQLRIVLSIKDKLNYLEQPILPSPLAHTGQHAWIKGSKKIAGLMLMTMDLEIQQNLEPLHAHEMLREQEEGQSISSYVLKMKGYIDNLERLGHPVTQGLGTVNELHAMLKLHEQTFPKSNAPALNVIRADKVQKGHWKMNYPQYLAELLKKKKNAASGAGGLVSSNNMVYFSAIPRDGLFEIDLSNSLTNESYIYDVSNKRTKLDLDSALLWHCRLGHISKKRIEKLQHDGLLDSSDVRAFEKCVSCMSGKMARKSYTHKMERAKDLLGLIHTDLKHKHEVFEILKVFQKEVENQLGKIIKSLRSDRGGEYMSQEFLDHLKDHGIIAHRTPPYTPQHNGVSKRRNKTLLYMVRSMMSQTTLLKSFWDYALETAACILNMVSTKKVEKTPYENKVLVARNAEFLENSLINQEASGSLEDHKIIQKEDTHPSIDTSLNYEEDDPEIDEPQSDIVPIRRSTRTRHAPDRMCLYIDAEEHELRDLGEPTNYKATLLDPESKKWLNAMKVEMQSMKDNEVWVLVELPPNGKTVGSKWLFKKKTDMDGNVQIYKARLVEKGYTQTPGIDYEETFSPVADRGVKKVDPTRTRLEHIRNPGDIYWTTVKNILKYLRITKDMFLVYGEAKYIAAFDASKEAVWVRKFISGLGVVPIIEEPISMYCDNTEAIAIANESRITKGARHFHAKVHYLREVIEYGDIKLEKVHTDENFADLSTKATTFPKHSEHTRNIGMLPASSLM
nr:hypothetical protein [Tanacetum cinerariifolium]